MGVKRLGRVQITIRSHRTSYLCTTGYFKTGVFSIYYREMLFDCSKLLNHTHHGSGAGVRGAYATFDVWVEAFGAELLFLLF